MTLTGSVVTPSKRVCEPILRGTVSPSLTFLCALKLSPLVSRWQSQGFTESPLCSPTIQLTDLLSQVILSHMSFLPNDLLLRKLVPISLLDLHMSFEANKFFIQTAQRNSSSPRAEVHASHDTELSRHKAFLRGAEGRTWGRLLDAV